MNNRRSRWILAIVIFVPVVIGAVGWWLAYNATYHFAVVQPGVLYRSGNNSLRRLKIAIDEGHIHTIVALIDDKEIADPSKPQFAEEKAWAGSHGIRYIRLPVRLGGWPNSDQIQQFLRIAANPADQPVLVHCAQGVRRTGMFVAAFQESQLHWSPDQTKAAIRSFGHGPGTVENIDAFIDHYDPKSEVLTLKSASNGAED
jgi:uncharacterized protein (TIGR01244 family)